MAAKARVELLEESTGSPIEEVDLITNCSTVYYINEDKMPQQVGAIEEGTVFDETGLDKILTGLLYPYTKPTPLSVSFSNGDIPSGTIEDTTVYKELGKYVDSFTMSVVVKAGSETSLTGMVNIYKDDTSVESLSQSKSCAVGDQIIFTFEIPQLTMDSDIQFSVSDSVNTITGISIGYDFINPAYVGFVPLTVLDDDGELSSTDEIVSWLNVVINNGSPNMEKILSTKCDIDQIIRRDVNYDTKEYMYPCIAVPKSWGSASAIRDMNGNNIIKTYALSTSVLLTTNSNASLEYIVYVCRYKYYNNDAILKCITYEFSKEENVNFQNYKGKFIPSISGFDVKYEVPIDSRFVVEKYDDLLGILYPYEGLLTYVKEIKTFFKYEDSNWVVTCNRFHLVESKDELTAEYGGWDDVAIVTDGTILKKRYNNVWETWGNITGSTSGDSSSCETYTDDEIKEGVADLLSTDAATTE